MEASPHPSFALQMPPCGAVQIYDLGNGAHARDARERERQSANRKRLRPTALICRQGVRGTVYGLRAAALRRLAFNTRLRAQSPRGVKNFPALQWNLQSGEISLNGKSPDVLLLLFSAKKRSKTELLYCKKP